MPRRAASTTSARTRWVALRTPPSGVTVAFQTFIAGCWTTRPAVWSWSGTGSHSPSVLIQHVSLYSRGHVESCHVKDVHASPLPGPRNVRHTASHPAASGVRVKLYTGPVGDGVAP